MKDSTSDDLLVTSKSSALAGKSIGLCVGGGIAAIEVPKIARELRRMGASVKIFATEAALKFVGKDALEWSSASPATVHASGLAEHISQEDGVLVFPATTDLIGKAANGVCPDACSTYIQSALGQAKPVMFLPTMHDSLRNSPAFKRNIEILSGFTGVSFISPRVEEGKWKAPSPETIALEVAFRCNQRTWKTAEGQFPHALVSLGGTVSKIDVARTISNLSTGTLGALLVRELLEHGIAVTALCGQRSVELPSCSGLTALDCGTFENMQSHFSTQTTHGHFDGLFHLAAISDFGGTGNGEHKISSSKEEITLQLKKFPKLIAAPELRRIGFKVACKFTASDSTEDQLKAEKLLQQYHLDAILWNWGSQAFGPSQVHECLLLMRDGAKTEIRNKPHAVREIATNFYGYLREKTKI